MKRGKKSTPNKPQMRTAKSPSNFIGKETVQQSMPEKRYPAELFEFFYSRNPPKSWVPFRKEVIREFQTTSTSIEDLTPVSIEVLEVLESEALVLTGLTCRVIYRPITKTMPLDEISLGYFETLDQSALITGGGTAFDAVPNFRNTALAFSYSLTHANDVLFNNKTTTTGNFTPYFVVNSDFTSQATFNQLNTNVLALPEFNNATYVLESGSLNIDFYLVDEESSSFFGSAGSPAYNYLPSSLKVLDDFGGRGFLISPLIIWTVEGYRLNRTDSNVLRKYIIPHH